MVEINKIYTIDYIMKNNIDKSSYGFIYITTNLLNNKKYIGKRTFGNRWKNYLGSGAILRKAILKYKKENFSKVIIDLADTKEELNKKEKYYINKYDAIKKLNFYNVATGGDGGFTGKTRIGKDNSMSKPVVMLSIENGDVIKEFECVREAKDYLKIKSSSNINKACKEKRGVAYGHRWLFKDDYEYFINNNIEFKDWFDRIKKLKNRKVYMLEIDTLNILNEYNSIKEAGDKTNIHKTQISLCCNHGCNTAGGYSWIFVDEYHQLNKEELHKLFEHKGIPNDKRFKKAIICLNTKEIFNSVKLASETYNIHSSDIIKCCKKRRKSAGKHQKTGKPLRWAYYNKKEQNT